MGILTEGNLPKSLHFKPYQKGMLVGDLCSLSWNGSIRAYAIIVGFAPTSVRMWPVTAPKINWQGAVKIAPFDVWVWPGLQCDIGRPLISGKAGNIPLKRLKEINRAINSGNASCPGSSECEVDTMRMNSLIDEWQELSNFTEPEGLGKTYRVFDGYELQKRGMNSEQLHNLLKIKQPVANSLMQGSKLPTREQTVAVCQRLRCDPGDVLSNDLPDHLARLCQPDMKKLVVEYAMKKSINEERARLNVIEASLKPARSTGSKGDRLRAIIEELSA